MSVSDVAALDRLLDFVGRDEGHLSLNQVWDEDTNREFWQMEISGRWFEGATARECFLRALRTWERTPITPETLSGLPPSDPS